MKLKLFQLVVFQFLIIAYSSAADSSIENVSFNRVLASDEYIVYYENGFVQEKGTWSNGKNYGDFIRYFENGNISQEFYFNEKGRRSGVQKYYYISGQLRVIGTWKDGNEDGDIISYNVDGTIKNIKQYIKGELTTVISEVTEINNYLSTLEDK